MRSVKSVCCRDEERKKDREREREIERERDKERQRNYIEGGKER